MKSIKNNFVSVYDRSYAVDINENFGDNSQVFKYVHEETLLKLDVVDNNLDLDSAANARLDAWCSFVDQIIFDFHGNRLISATLTGDEMLSDNASKVIKDFCDAIAEYRGDFEGSKHRLEISSDAARNYLYLIPAFGRHSHDVTIDADTGFVNIGFRSRRRELLTALVTNKGEIHYSFVGRGRRLVKISGTAKIKDKRDFVSFRKILRMMWAV